MMINARISYDTVVVQTEYRRLSFSTIMPWGILKYILLNTSNRQVGHRILCNAYD